MMKNVKLMSGKELLKADAVMLNNFVEKCAPIWNPVFADEFQREGFNIIKYSNKMSEIMDNLRYQMTLKKLDKYDIKSEIQDFIDKEDLTKYESEDILVGCMYLMATQQIIMESVLSKDNVNEEMYMFNLVKGFIFSTKDLNMENVLDLSFIEIPDTLKLTIESLLSEEDRKYVRF